MNRRMTYRRRLGRFARNEDGTSLVELAMSVALFLLVVFGAIDFARFYFHFVAAEKSLGVAARIAAVRPPACSGVPATNAPGAAPASAILPEFGVSCGGTLVDSTGAATGGQICAAVSTSCTLNTAAGNAATVQEIWTVVRGSLPPGAAQSNVRVSYDFDPALNFLGGPYVPNVTVEVENLEFNFISPIGQLATLAGAANASFDQSPPFPSLSATVPGEDLASGNDG